MLRRSMSGTKASAAASERAVGVETERGADLATKGCIGAAEGVKRVEGEAMGEFVKVRGLTRPTRGCRSLMRLEGEHKVLVWGA